MQSDCLVSELVLLFVISFVDKPSVKVMGSLAFGVFDGRIRDGEEVYYIEPSNRSVCHC